MNTSQNKKKKKQKKREKKDRKSTYDHSEIISGIIKFIPESEMIRSMVKYSTGKTRHYLAISLVISLIIVMMFFGVLHAVVEKEIIESLDEFIRYSLTILGSLTSTAIGFFFGRVEKIDFPWKKPLQGIGRSKVREEVQDD